MTESRELVELIAARNEVPVCVAVGADPHDTPELYRFADGTEVVVTNAGVVAEDAEGFADLRAAIMADPR